MTLTDTTTTVACPFCGADASPLHSIADWRRTGATRCEWCGAGCPSRGDWTRLRIVTLDHAHWRIEWPAQWWGSADTLARVQLRDDGGIGDVETTGRFTAAPMTGGLPAPMRPTANNPYPLDFSSIASPHDIEIARPPGDVGRCECSSGDCVYCGGNGYIGDDDACCEACDGDGECRSCHGTGRTDGRRGVGEDYDPGDGSTWQEMEHDTTRAWRTLEPVANVVLHAAIYADTEIKARASREAAYTGAPGNHLATLPAGRLVLEARARRVDAADDRHDLYCRLAKDAERDDRRDLETLYGRLANLCSRWRSQSPDLPRAHVSDAPTSYTHIDSSTRGNVQAWMHRQFSTGRAPDPE